MRVQKSKLCELIAALTFKLQSEPCHLSEPILEPCMLRQSSPEQNHVSHKMMPFLIVSPNSSCSIKIHTVSLAGFKCLDPHHRSEEQQGSNIQHRVKWTKLENKCTHFSKSMHISRVVLKIKTKQNKIWVITRRIYGADHYFPRDFFMFKDFKI